MKRFFVTVCALLGTLAAVLAAVPVTATAENPGTRGAVSGTVVGTVVGVSGRTFAVEAGGGRMPVIAALTRAASDVTAADFPYVYGGGHGQAGIASIGSKGPGYNGRRIGFDCSGSVAAVLSGAGLWPVATGVPSDAGVIDQLRREHLIAPGRGRGATEVTLYDNRGSHIFMEIDGQFFGTSDGAGGGNPNGGAGWLDDGAPDASSRHYKPYHLLPGVLRQQTTLERIFTLQTRGHVAAVTHGLLLGSAVHVAYTVAPNGSRVAQTIR
jgi:hypothetical protein